jgi:hypothetical protein
MPSQPEVPAEIAQYLARLSVPAGQLGRVVDGASERPEAAGRDLDQAAARAAARLKIKVEERAGDAPGRVEDVTARLTAAFPQARVAPEGDGLRLTVPVRATRAQRIVLEVEFGAPTGARVPVRLRGFGMEGRISSQPTRTVTDRAWAAITSDAS